MPDRAHLWRGIHDREMVRQAVEIELFPAKPGGDGVGASLVLQNRDVGHAFPTYITPRVFLEIYQADAEGAELPDTLVAGTIGREVDLARGEEIFDTRVLPGESVRLDYELPRAAGARELVARVRVEPDYHYRGVFAQLLETLSDSRARELIGEAARRAAASAYVLEEIRQPLGGGD